MKNIKLSAILSIAFIAFAPECSVKIMYRSASDHKS